MGITNPLIDNRAANQRPTVVLNKKCDGTRNLSGCRRCAQARIKCGGYSDTSSRVPRLKHGVRKNQLQNSPTHGCSESSNDTLNSTTPSIEPRSLDDARSAESSSASATHIIEYPNHPTFVPISRNGTNTHSGYSYISYAPHYVPPTGHNPNPIEYFPGRSTGQVVPANRMLISPVPNRLDNRDVQPHAVQRFIISSQANSANPAFCPAQPEPVAPLTPESPRSTAKGSDTGKLPISNIAQQESPGMQPSSSCTLQSQTNPTIEWPVPYFDSEPELEDSENIEARILNELVPDRQLESNTLPFIVHSFAAWMTRFVFDPTRILPFLINHIRRGYSFGDETRQTMLLISNSALAISESTDYNLVHFNTLHKLLTDRVADVRARGDTELTREVALGAMEHSHQLISTLFKVGSLANVLNTMELYAPVFRRACPESDEELVNLPRRLTGMEIQLKYFSALDVLQSIMTHRPMFFRYDLELLSPQEEMFVKSGNGPGLRWLYGVPDRLMVVLARMNILFEDFGNRMNLETVRELEEEIAACEPIVCTGAEFDPALNFGRMVVQEAWRLAANIYLYMALCGADSTHPQVVQVQKKFMKLLRRVNPCRNPDSFLVLPILILGVATSSPTGRSTLLARLLGISECSRPGTVGNDVVRMLSDVWVHAIEKPAVWADLGMACLRVTGM